MIKELNQEIEKSKLNLKKNEILSTAELNKIEYLASHKEKELKSNKLTLNMYLQYYASFSNKSNEKLTHQK